jgi:hypothetical protein
LSFLAEAVGSKNLTKSIIRYYEIVVVPILSYAIENKTKIDQKKEKRFS